MMMTKSEFFDLMADNMAKFEVRMDTGKITWVTKTLERLFGYILPGSLDDKVIEVLIPNGLREQHTQQHRPSFAVNPEPRLMGRHLSISGQRRDGTQFPCEVFLFPKMVGGVLVVAGIVLDMTTRSQQVVIDPDVLGSAK